VSCRHATFYTDTSQKVRRVEPRDDSLRRVETRDETSSRFETAESGPPVLLTAEEFNNAATALNTSFVCVSVVLFSLILASASTLVH
jgi:hypothetical protein